MTLRDPRPNITFLNLTWPVDKPTDPLVTVITWFTLFAILATLLCNGIIVFVYFTQSQMRTPFNAYIVNIAITETLLALTAMPGNFIRSYYGYWPYNAVSCSFLMYVQQIFGTGVRYGHLLVTVNRVWAVTFPVSYRAAHTNRCARLLIVATWVYLHVLSLPMLLRGRLGMGTASTDRNCQNDEKHQFGGAVATEIIGFDIPELLIVMAYPYILFKLRQTRWRPRNRVRPPGPFIVSFHSAALSQPGRAPTKSGINIASVPDARYAHDNSRRPPMQLLRSHSRVLAYLVGGIVICWTPNHVFFLLVETRPGYWDQNFYAVQYFMQYTYSWINPILCYFGMRQLRDAVNELFLPA